MRIWEALFMNAGVCIQPLYMPQNNGSLRTAIERDGKTCCCIFYKQKSLTKCRYPTQHGASLSSLWHMGAGYENAQRLQHTNNDYSRDVHILICVSRKILKFKFT
jgi:hypothetical protein